MARILTVAGISKLTVRKHLSICPSRPTKLDKI